MIPLNSLLYAFLLCPTAALGYNYMAKRHPVRVNMMPDIQMFRNVQMVDLILQFCLLWVLSALWTQFSENKIDG